jgi:hypothetical protein
MNAKAPSLSMLILMTACAVPLLGQIKRMQRDPVVVLMDTTAPTGIYDRDNRATGASNAKELFKILEPLLPAEGLHAEPLYAGWDREAYVTSLRPDLVIIHRSSFFHSFNAEFKFGLSPQFSSPAHDEKWRLLYRIADDKLISVIANIGNEVPHARFLVYSRGTDTNWLRDDFRSEWATKVGDRFPKLRHRITTMVIPHGYEGSFRQPDTADLLRSNVTAILNFAKK